MRAESKTCRRESHTRQSAFAPIFSNAPRHITHHRFSGRRARARVERACRRRAAFVARLFARSARNRMRIAENRLDAALSDRVAIENARGRHAPVRQSPLLRRICLRLVMGRCVSQTRPPLLSKARMRRSFYARNGSAAHRSYAAPAPATPQRRAGASRGSPPVIAAHSFSRSAGVGALRARRAADARKRAISLDQSRLWEFRRLPG